MLPIIPVSQDIAPDTLLDLSFKYIVKHLDIICTVNPHTHQYTLKDGLALPSEICEKLLQIYQEGGYVVNDKIVTIFENLNMTRLRRVRLRNSNISDEGLCILLRHNLTELDLRNCIHITECSLKHLNKHGESMISLSFGPGVQLLPSTLTENGSHQHTDESSVYYSQGYILNTPNLRRLAIKHLFIHRQKLYFPLLIRPLTNLTHLDMSTCFDLGDLWYLADLKNLLSLVLFNVQRLQEAVPALCQLKTLRHLDISQISEKHGTYRNENIILAKLVESLPNLTSLDISGTNLAGTGVAEHSPGLKESRNDCVERTDIPGLNSRVAKPLEFLGLYGTRHEACRRHHIPAKLVSGNANEEQILIAASAYIDRTDILQQVLNDLYHLFRYEICHDMNKALNIVLEAMDRHVCEKHIQISGSATLFYIVKGKEKYSFSPSLKRLVVQTLLNGMNTHRDDDTMMRNGCLTLCQFRLPEDVIFDYERLVQILLHIVSEMEQEGFVQRIGIFLLNTLACQVDGLQKKLLGDLGAVSKMLSLIGDRLVRKVCDDVLEVAWSTMWNVTDETAINCQRFLDGRGMEFFLGCLSTFPEKEELLRNMMGLLGNVAEVRKLRPRLMTSQFVGVFATLLDSSSDGIEVSYNAAGVLSHMASDGPNAWALTSPQREEVLLRMVAAIESWDLNTERNINYRSFEPILYLARVYHTPECQHWAVWALANLTRVYPAKYCSLVEAEGGIELLQEIIQHDEPYSRIKDLSTMVITHCHRYREVTGTLNN